MYPLSSLLLCIARLYHPSPNLKTHDLLPFSYFAQISSNSKMDLLLETAQILTEYYCLNHYISMTNQMGETLYI